MARKPKDDVNAELFEVGPDELEEVLSGLPSQDSSINLFRVNPQGAPSYISEFSPSDFSLEAVKNTYGGGKYKYVAKGAGMIRQGFFQVDGEPINLVKPVYKKYVNGKLIFAKPDDADVIVTDNARDLRRVTEQNAGETNVMVLLLSEIRALREAVQKPTQETHKDFLEQLIMYKNLFAPQSNPIQDFPKIAMDLIKQGMDVAGAAENGGSPWMLILDKIMPAIQDVLKVVQVQQTRPIPVNGQAMANQPQRPVELPRENLTGFDAIADDLRQYLPVFIRSASMGTDPAIMVDLTLQNIPEERNAIVLDWLRGESYFTDICKLHPAIQAQAGWWQDFRNGLIQGILAPPLTDEHEGMDS